MTAYYEADGLTLMLGDCRAVLAEMHECSFDAIITDPPYDLTAGKQGGSGAASENLNSPAGQARITTVGFMGKAWDGTGVAFDSDTWREALRVLKPGGHLLAFGSPRTYHRLACAIEDAGFEIRDSLMWLFGSGFPKSLDVSKALDKAAGAEREIVGIAKGAATSDTAALGVENAEYLLTSPATDLAAQWAGWGTALKPAYEPIVMARKPLVGTVAGNVAAYGVGGINVDACRIGESKNVPASPAQDRDNLSKGREQGRTADTSGFDPNVGRWPANLLLDDQAAVLLDAQSVGAGAFAPVRGTEPTKDAFSGPVYGEGRDRKTAQPFYGDAGGASRFFYTSKTSRSEREFALDDLEPAQRADGTRDDDSPGSNNPRLRTNARRNDHPTVKPVDLMRWLCRLITPPGGLICDPFLGSGSTGMAALDEGFRFVGIDLEPHYIEIARRRIARRHLIEPLPQRSEGQGTLI